MHRPHSNSAKGEGDISWTPPPQKARPARNMHGKCNKHGMQQAWQCCSPTLHVHMHMHIHIYMHMPALR